MNFVNILVLLAIGLVAVKAQYSVLDYYDNHNNSHIRSDDYLDANRRQYAANIWYYDYQIETFKELYLGRISTLDIQLDLLVNTLIRVNERLYPLTLLSDFSKNCVHKYKSLIPPLAAAKSDMQRCITNGNNMLNSLTTSVSTTNRTLQTYYSNNFERDVQNCRTKFNTSLELNYTLCLNNAIRAADTYTINNKKTFDAQMDTATNSARTYVKTAVECSYSVQNNTITMISKANTLIDKCLNGLDDCTRCNGHFCEEVYYIPSYQVDYKNATMKNPFYGRPDATNCLMLDIY